MEIVDFQVLLQYFLDSGWTSNLLEEKGNSLSYCQK